MSTAAVQGTVAGLATTLRRRLCAFAVGASTGCAAGMYYLIGDIQRANDAVAASVAVVAASQDHMFTSSSKIVEPATISLPRVDPSSSRPRISKS